MSEKVHFGVIGAGAIARLSHVPAIQKIPKAELVAICRRTKKEADRLAKAWKVEETVEFIKKLGEENVGLLIDTFHMNIEEVSIYQSIEKAKDYLTHVHFADSNRWAPGCGHLDFPKIVESLRKIGYKGYLSAEILPLPDPDTAARLAIKCLTEIDP